MIKKLQKYVKESIEELKKVSWPTKEETKNYTISVIFVSALVAVFLWALDLFFSGILKSLL